jgi:hypothetical protein
MKKTMRNLTLSAAALAALVTFAPKASAQDYGRNRGNAPQQQYYGNNGHGGGNDGHYHGNDGHYHGSYGHYHYAAPVYRYGWGYGYAPYHLYSGYRFYPYYPGAGYVYIAGFGWVIPPFFGAVWVPGHYDIGGVWIQGFWR